MRAPPLSLTIERNRPLRLQSSAASPRLRRMAWDRSGWAWWRAASVGVVGLALLVGACSSDGPPASNSGSGGAGTGGGSGSAGAPASSLTDLDSILASEARGYCARLFRCWEANDDFMGSRVLLETPAACEALLADLNAKSALIRDLRTQLSQGAIQIVASKARACLDELAACNGTDSFTRGSCRDMFEGQVSPGSPCQRAEDCAGDAFCDNASTCPGVCKARKTTGESCRNDGECTAGDGYTFCDRDLASGAACRTLPVAPKAALGEPCTRRLAGADKLSLCVDTLWCGSVAGQPATATLGTCQPPIPANGACSDSDDVCSEGVCNKATGACRSVTRLTHAGDACDEAEFRLCDPRLGLRCPGDQGRCEASGDGTPGAVCFSGDFQRTCNSGLYCQSGTVAGHGLCQPLLKSGTGCDQSSSCESGNCQSTCQERPCSF